MKRRGIVIGLVVVVFGGLGVWFLNPSSAGQTEEPPPSEAAAAAGLPPVTTNGQLHVCGRQLCNQHDKPVQLRGMSSHGIQWYGWGDCLNTGSIAALADDWQADILRVSLYAQEGGYETDPAGFTAMADTIIDAAIAQSLYVVIDWHQLEPGDPNYNTDRAIAYFTHMAQRYRDKPHVLYEIANEPSGVAWADIKRYADRLVPLIRDIDEDNIIIVGTPAMDTFGLSDDTSGSDVYRQPIRDNNLMYAFHFYAAEHGANYRQRLDEASSRLPVFVTEWGSQMADGDGRNDFREAQAYIDLIARKKISWINWNYSDDRRSGAAFTAGTCPDGPYTAAGGRLKPAGQWARNWLRQPADNFPVR